MSFRPLLEEQRGLEVLDVNYIVLCFLYLVHCFAMARCLNTGLIGLNNICVQCIYERTHKGSCLYSTGGHIAQWIHKKEESIGTTVQRWYQLGNLTAGSFLLSDPRSIRVPRRSSGPWPSD